jgi:hypothetical protein
MTEHIKCWVAMQRCSQRGACCHRYHLIGCCGTASAAFIFQPQGHGKDGIDIQNLDETILSVHNFTFVMPLLTQKWLQNVNIKALFFLLPNAFEFCLLFPAPLYNFFTFRFLKNHRLFSNCIQTVPHCIFFYQQFIHLYFVCLFIILNRKQTKTKSKCCLAYFILRHFDYLFF